MEPAQQLQQKVEDEDDLEALKSIQRSIDLKAQASRVKTRLNQSVSLIDSRQNAIQGAIGKQNYKRYIDYKESLSSQESLPRIKSLENLS